MTELKTKYGTKGVNQQDDNISKTELQTLIKSSVADALKSAGVATPQLPSDDNNKKERSNGESEQISALEKILKKSVSNDVQIPTKSAKEGGSWGNLPIHEKQLGNILLRRDAFTGLEQEKAKDEFYHRLKALEAMQKDFDATTAGAGLEYIPSNLTGALLRDLELMPAIHGLFEMIKTNAMVEKRPNLQGNFNFQLVGTDVATPDIGQTTTGQTTLTNKNFRGYVDYSVDLSEQSVVDLIPIIQESLVRAWSRNLDDAILNGDDTATHQDTDIAALAATDYRKGWKGLRKLALAVATLVNAGAGGAIATTDIINQLKLMKKYAARLTRLATIIPVQSQFTLFNTSDWKDATLMLAKWGTQAEIERGLVGYISGTPVYNSEFQRSDVNAAAGVNAASGNTFATAITVHRDMFKVSVMKGIKLIVHTPESSSEMARLNVNRIFGYVKAGFNPVFTPAAGKEVVAITRNITA
jgi:HK97 family phage major capsid protein